MGGSILFSSTFLKYIGKIADFLERLDIRMLFCIGVMGRF